jgi:hypothetical protein
MPRCIFISVTIPARPCSPDVHSPDVPCRTFPLTAGRNNAHFSRLHHEVQFRCALCRCHGRGFCAKHSSTASTKEFFSWVRTMADRSTKFHPFKVMQPMGRNVLRNLPTSEFTPSVRYASAQMVSIRSISNDDPMIPSSARCAEPLRPTCFQL